MASKRDDCAFHAVNSSFKYTHIISYMAKYVKYLIPKRHIARMAAGCFTALKCGYSRSEMEGPATGVLQVPLQTVNLGFDEVGTLIHFS